MPATRLFAAAALGAGLAQAQTWRLDSEKRASFGPTGPTHHVFTAYEYDAEGHRIAKRAYAGTHAGAPPLGRTDYVYGGDGRLAREITVDGADTLSDAQYFYTQYPGPERIEVRGAGGTLRYTDSLAYDSRARLIAEVRRTSAGVLIFGRRYAYDDASRLLADTLLEPDGGLIKPSQIRSLAYHPDGTVQSESHARLADGNWFTWKIVHMGYSAGRLAAAVTKEGGITKDSLAYGYDANGNRILQDRFDGDQNRLETIVYNWSAITRIFVRPQALSDPRHVRGLERTALRVGVRSFDLRGRSLNSFTP